MKLRDIDKMTDEEMKRKLMSAELKKRKVLGCIGIPLIIFIILIFIFFTIMLFSLFGSFSASLQDLDRTEEMGQPEPEIVTDYYKFG